MRRGKAAKSEPQTANSLADMNSSSADDHQNNPRPPTPKSSDESDDKKTSNQPSYFDAVKTIGTVHTVEEFWQMYDYLVRPNDLPTTTDYHFFREGIQPTWEDPHNAKGGKWIVRLKKGLASRYWEEVILALLGGQFPGVPDGEVCGAVVSIRYSEDIVSVWNKTANDREIADRVRDAIKRILQLPSHVHMEYKPHQASLADKSSFRNTQVWRPKSLEGRSASSGVGGERGGVGERGGRGGDHRDAPIRRTGSWGDRDEIRGTKPKQRTEVERAWR